MRGLVHREPLLGRDLVRADHRAHLVVEDLGRRPRQRAEAERAQPRQVVRRAGARASPRPARPRAPRRRGRAGRAARVRIASHDRGVVVAGEGRVDPALEADLGRAALPGLARAADDLVERDEVRRAAQVRRQPALREGAEAAAEVADVRVLDVPRDDVADLVAAHLAPEPVGGGEDALALVAARRGRAARARPRPARPSCRPGSASRRTTNGTAPGSPGCQRVLAREPERVRRAQRRAAARPGRPTRRRGSAGRRAAAARARARATASPRASRSRSGHGASGLTWSIVTGRDAAPVVDAGVEQAREVVVGEVRRRLHGDVAGQQRAARPRSSRGGRRALGSGVRGHPRPRLGAEVLDDHLLQVAVPLVQRRAARSSASSRSARVSPIPIRIPLVNGIRSSPASSIVSSRRAGSLSGEAQCGPPFADEPLGDRLEHDPHRGRDRAQRAELVPAHHARVQVRQQARSPRARASRTRPRYSSVVSQPSAASSSRATL